MNNTVESIKHLFLETGAGWVLWLLAGLSVISFAVALERWRFYRNASGSLPQLAEELSQRLSSFVVQDHDGSEDASTDSETVEVTQIERSHVETIRVETIRAETIGWLESTNTIAARVAVAGLKLADHGTASVERAIQSRLTLERETLDRGLAFLGTLGNNAPFIGLFGTVIGVIQAFEELGHSAAGHAGSDAASQVASGAVMSAIAEALVATAVGIAVALPAVAAYNYLQRVVEELLAGAEVLSGLVLAYLESEHYKSQKDQSSIKR